MKLCFCLDRARWGISGTLLLTIRYSEVEFPAKAWSFLVCTFVSSIEGVGPVQRMLCKLRQDREVAAVAEIFLVLQINLT